MMPKSTYEKGHGYAAVALYIAFVICTAFAVGAVNAQPITTLTNATVYTVDAQRSVAEALAIDDKGIIVAVGSNADIIKRFGRGVDLDGAMVLPGFHDVHLHAVEAGISAQFCVLSQFGSAADYRHELAECAASQPDSNWVSGAGVNMAALLETVDDPLALADSAIPDRPVVILDDLGHGAWGNSLAMRAGGFHLLADDPPGGIIVRHPDDRLSGVVLESSAQVLIDAAQPINAHNLAFAEQSLQFAMQELAANGITSVSDAGGYWPRGHEQVWQRLAQAGSLTVRASNALYVYPHLPIDTQLPELIKRFSNNRNRPVRFNQVKLYVDGILSQTTSLLTTPYITGAGSQKGFAYFSRADLFAYAKALSQAGFQLHFHATGDAGTRLALDAIAQADPASGPHRITHLYLVHENDLQRFTELNVIADLQLAPSSTANDYRTSIAELIGDRVEQLMPLNALHAAGATITISSDWDADSLSPINKLETLLTLPDDQAPTLADAIEMMTINAAQLLQQSTTTGSIEVGKAADIVVLSADLFALPTAEFSRVKVLATLLQGDVVFDPQKLFD